VRHSTRGRRPRRRLLRHPPPSTLRSSR
jgi:hypothetical protein